VYANTLNKGDTVVKAMVLSGGRGLGTFKNGFKGGVHLATNLKDVKKMTEAMLGQKLVTKQSGPDGIICNKVRASPPSLPPSLPPFLPPFLPYLCVSVQEECPWRVGVWDYVYVGVWIGV